MRVCILGGRGRGKTLGTLGTLESGKSNMSNDLCLFFFFFSLICIYWDMWRFIMRIQGLQYSKYCCYIRDIIYSTKEDLDLYIYIWESLTAHHTIVISLYSAYNIFQV